MISRLLLAPLFLSFTTAALAHEFPGHAEHERKATLALGTELYVGHDGYWHAGAGVRTALRQELTLEVGTHVVRENRDAREVPSFEAELIWEPGGGVELELFGFHYPVVERRHAWGVGARATRRFAFQETLSVAPFFGPAFAEVRAEKEAAGTFETVRHTLLLGGVTVEAGPVSVTLIASQSLYDAEEGGLETPVDFESMSHFAAYENNDGFPQQTMAIEIAWSVTRWLTFQARYAVLRFATETRHALAVTPAVRLAERVELSAGVQWLRGGEVENDLAFAGVSLSF